MLDRDEFQLRLNNEWQDRLYMMSLWLHDPRVVSSLDICNRAEFHYIALPLNSFSWRLSCAAKMFQALPLSSYPRLHLSDSQRYIHMNW
jgi:hypothetical protein